MDRTKRGRRRTGEDPLAVTAVIDRLEVGPPRIEKRKVATPYGVTREGRSATFQLEYVFEEDVFDRERPADRNLASMMGAQVALNYGLFCREVVFNGHFAEPDRRFLESMAKNTAREIYINKFLKPNPFLRGDAAHLPTDKRSSYLAGEIRFNDSDSAEEDESADSWESRPDRHAVLSSGGKDSLLSLALLDEVGVEAHPIFVNESGRHWFTALNSYRGLRTGRPETARVWTNSDRLFSWMLRHLPFVRQDFARVRSDEYPIRLWTVAVFLFGVLPLLRKRGIGRLVIGDEFDTTREASHRGIKHYDGLYDQSRFFDESLTRYFMRKGWNISQFSMLRQLSELLVQKVLAERYPEYQKDQLSCHAAHVEGRRVHPCGRCEKCRRIVGMLLALDIDPRHCGYSSAQIEDCRQSIVERGVHQESEASRHLAALLSEKQVIKLDQGSKMRATRYPEIEKLRFHDRRSPVEGIPSDLRQPLYSILLSHASGAVKKHGRQWVDFEVLADPSLFRAYPFETPAEHKTAAGSRDPAKQMKKNVHVLGELTWPEAEVRFREVDVALLPVGAIEQHGPHLPLDTDAFDADHLAREVAAACVDPKPLVLPLIPYGVSYHHDDFAGTISISNDTLARLVYEIGMSAARNGIAKLIIINGHGGNAATLKFAAQMINRDAHIFTCVDTGETSDADVGRMIETPNDVHAGEIETSTVLALRPELVDMTKAPKFVPRFSGSYLNFSSERSVEWFARTEKISKSGVLGDATKATSEKGRRIWDIMIENLREFVEQIKGMTLDEIYERRY